MTIIPGDQSLVLEQTANLCDAVYQRVMIQVQFYTGYDEET